MPRLTATDIVYAVEEKDFKLLLDGVADVRVDEKARRRVAAALIREGNMEVANEALARINETDATGAELLLEVGYRLGARDLSSVARALLEADTDIETSATAAWILHESGASARDWLHAGLHSTSAGARGWACIAIEEGRVSGYCDSLQSLVSDSDEKVRHMAIMAISASECKDCKKALASRFDAGKKEALLAAINLAKLGEARFALKELADSDASWVTKKLGAKAIQRTERRIAQPKRSPG